MLDFIIFEEGTHPVRCVAIVGRESELMIFTEDLEAVLINEDGGYTSPEARLIDEHIFFYVPEGIAMDCSDEEVAKFVCRCMNDVTSYL